MGRSNTPSVTVLKMVLPWSVLVSCPLKVPLILVEVTWVTVIVNGGRGDPKPVLLLVLKIVVDPSGFKTG